MLSNEKYIGDVMVLKTYSSGFPENRRVPNSGNEETHPMYLVEQSHEAIIDRDVFDAVQKEKIRRSNIVQDTTGTHRSTTKYSAKKSIEK